MSGVKVAPLTRDELVQQLGDGGTECAAFEYLLAYLLELGAASVVIEQRYVDRHYLDEFAAYYSRSFNAPDSWCSRLHFFTLTADAVSEELDRAHQSRDGLTAAEDSLQKGYIGFVVNRPLPGARIGRTVVRTYSGDPLRQYEVVRPYRANLGSIRLEVVGLAFQQQDGGVAVCASTALWSALQAVAHVAGHRTPTPIAVTRAAGSPFPASDGLTDSQMAAALAALGYTADYFTPGTNYPLFRAKVVSSLRSKLPVLLSIENPEKGQHVVAVTGYREPSSPYQVPLQSFTSIEYMKRPVAMRSAAASTIYCHDDNLGFHAHYELYDDEATQDLMLRRGDKDRNVWWWEPDEWIVSAALVPKPDKLRMSLQTLLADIPLVRQPLELALPGVDLTWEARFASGVEYRRSLFSYDVDFIAMRDFQDRLSLPRHVGIISAFYGDTLVCDAILDVSEVQRNELKAHFLGIVAPAVAAGSDAEENLREVSDEIDTLLLTGPQRPAPSAQ